MKIKTILLMTLLTLHLSALTIGKVPKLVTIEGDDGGLVKDGSIWNSSTIREKAIIMFYIDPDKKNINSHFTARLEEKGYTREKNRTIVIINLAATWKPNFVIEKILKAEQKEFPQTLYVQDRNSVLVNEWGLDDDASDVILFSKTGEVLFYKSGKMSEEDMQEAFKIIEENTLNE